MDVICVAPSCSAPPLCEEEEESSFECPQADKGWIYLLCIFHIHGKTPLRLSTCLKPAHLGRLWVAKRLNHRSASTLCQQLYHPNNLSVKLFEHPAGFSQLVLWHASSSLWKLTRQNQFFYVCSLSVPPWMTFNPHSCCNQRTSGPSWPRRGRDAWESVFVVWSRVIVHVAIAPVTLVGPAAPKPFPCIGNILKLLSLNVISFTVVLSRVRVLWCQHEGVLVIFLSGVRRDAADGDWGFNFLCHEKQNSKTRFNPCSTCETNKLLRIY